LLRVGAALEDRLVKDLPSILQPGDLMVFNDTKVIPAQLYGTRGTAKIEVTLHKRENENTWRSFARPGRRLRIGDTVDFTGGFTAEVLEKNPEGEVILRFDRSAGDLLEALHRHGEMPLPPYIRKLRKPEAKDAADYQTVYARVEGAVAAPTAGLHFTPELLQALDTRGIERVSLTLHVGAGTFLPVKAEELKDHKMHAEWGEIGVEAAQAINRARHEGRRVVSVGTTALRLMESAIDSHGRIQPFSGDTDIFIAPGYRIRSADLLMTNFHLPKSTLFMLVAAFAGLERMKAAYRHAIHNNYRFFSYGDSSLLERAS
jgi:S-adenosylmethionine:tRNA ribosyltransferase-isomerase